MDRLEAVRELVQHDHAILNPDFARTIAAPFGVNPTPGRFRVGVGRVESGPSGEWSGVSAHDLAHTLAEAIGLQEGRDYPSQHGIGSQLRVACAAIEKALTA